MHFDHCYRIISDYRQTQHYCRTAREGPHHIVRPADGVREDLPILKQELVKLTLGQRPLITWVFVANITDEFFLGLDVLRTHDASVDLGRRVLRLGDEEVSLWRPEVDRFHPPIRRATTTRYQHSGGAGGRHHGGDG
jgi:hypothetical protein